MERRLSDIVPTRRDVIKWGTAAVAGTWIDRVVWPLKVRAAGKANPRGTARNCIFIEMGGAISHLDCWDYKEHKGQPKDLDVRKVNSDVYLSKKLFPRLSDRMDRVALVRSMRAIGLLHFNGQYHTQAGRALNAAVGREIPGFGSVIAYELEGRRLDADTFPTFVSTSLGRARVTLRSGFLPARFAPLDLDPQSIFAAFEGGTDVESARMLLKERFRLLSGFAKVSAAERASMSTKAPQLNRYYEEAFRILNDSRWPEVFMVTEDEKERYGEDPFFSQSIILARNLIAADAGTHFVYVYDGDRWDQHTNIFDKTANLNHYDNCYRFDKGITALLDDMAAMPGKEPGKSLLDETLVVCTSEFGRTPKMNPGKGRDHWRFVYTTMFAGGGVQGGRVIGSSDEEGGYCVDTGWKHKEQPWHDNTVATMYSALGIDWKKSIGNTPSGRDYHYIETAPLGGSEFISDDEIAELFE